MREIAPPAAFVLTEETFPVEITEDGQTIEIRIENQIIKGIAETTKVDADYPENKLSGAVFEIYADVDNNGEFDAEIDQLVGEMTETEPGLYQMKDLVWGKRGRCADRNRSWRGLPPQSADRLPEGGKDSRR